VEDVSVECLGCLRVGHLGRDKWTALSGPFTICGPLPLSRNTASLGRAVHTPQQSHTVEYDPSIINSQLASRNSLQGLMGCEFGHMTLQTWMERIPRIPPSGR